jgi:hypothetical protein
MSAESNTASTAADLSITPVREFTLRSAFALSFSDISPIVGIYSVFGLGLAVAGPAFFWAFPVVLIGQLLVSGVFGDLVAKWPFSGSVYAWARELAGARYGWFTNWAGCGDESARRHRSELHTLERCQVGRRCGRHHLR